MKTYSVKLPATRDPFINAKLKYVGRDPETGEERFWSSTWNSNSGAIGALVCESGKSRIFRFDVSRKQYGFYSAAYAEDETMWLCGFISEVIKLDFRTGETVSFKTGLPNNLLSSGMAYDPSTGKLFAATYCDGDMKRKGFSFDTNKGEVCAVYHDLPLSNNQLRHSIRNSDGTITFVNIIPGIELLSWDPRTDKTELILASLPYSTEQNYYSLVSREDDAIYIPEYGWFDPLLKRFVEGPAASRGALWFGISNNIAYGGEYTTGGHTILIGWDLASNTIRTIAEIPDSLPYQFLVGENGNIYCINMYGYFYCIDPVNRAITTSSRLDTDSFSHVDLVFRVNPEKLLCTTFITQRFYELDLTANTSKDLGRATGGCGEVMRFSSVGGKIYMASYTEGQLTEYDPGLPTFFPENPRIVVHPPECAMRPVAMCADDKSIYYSCSHKYGYLGSMLISYTPGTGHSQFSDNTIPDQMIIALLHSKKYNVLAAGTLIHADCRSCPPKAARCVAAFIDQSSLTPVSLFEAPDGYTGTELFGEVEDDVFIGRFVGAGHKAGWFLLDAATLTLSDFTVPDEISGLPIYGTGIKNRFVICSDGNIAAWDLKAGRLVSKICDTSGYYNLFARDRCLYLLYRDEMKIWEDCF